jgi:uncharacterized membrane protein YidH (DUF202 family)
MAVTTFTPLFSSTWKQFRTKIRLIVPGAAFFAIVISILQMPSDVDNINHTASVIGGVGLVVGAVVTLASYAYYLLVASRSANGNAMELGNECVRRTPSFIVLALWLMVRTLSILVLIGTIIMPIGALMSSATLVGVATLCLLIGLIGVLIWGPRYLLAPAFWAIESKGIVQSAKRSFEATRGYWGKVFGNVLLLSLLFFFVIAIVSAVLGAAAFPFATSGQLILSVLLGFVSQCYQGFLSIFLVLLAETIAANPIKK